MTPPPAHGGTLANTPHDGLWQTRGKSWLFGSGKRWGAADLAGCPAGLALQVLVNLRYGDRPFPDGGGDPFHRAGAHVADGEHSREAGFQRKRHRLARGWIFAGQVAAGQDEPALIPP